MSLFEPAGGCYLRAFYMLFQVEESNYFLYGESDEKYRFNLTMMPENGYGVPARITAVHMERYEFICEFGQTFYWRSGNNVLFARKENLVRKSLHHKNN